LSVAWFLSLKIKKGAMFYKKGAMLKTLRPFYVFDFNKFFFQNRTKNEQRAQRRNNRKIGVSLYACNFFICVYAHIFFYLLIHKKCHFIKHCALFVKIRGIIYINQSFTAGRNVSTLRPKLRPFCQHCALFAK